MTQQHKIPVSGQLLSLSTGLTAQSTPGSFKYAVDHKALFYNCPCGCKDVGALTLRTAEHSDRPSWLWDGNETKPTLTPSIRRVTGCKWHGWLRAGMWVPEGDSGV